MGGGEGGRRGAPKRTTGEGGKEGGKQTGCEGVKGMEVIPGTGGGVWWGGLVGVGFVPV